MTVQFATEGSNRLKYRTVVVNLFTPYGRRIFESTRPKLGVLGQWALDLGGRFALPSRKNARLNGDQGNLIYIRKYRKGGIEVQTEDNEIGPVCLFALCVASFLGRK
jgi:hypothetical protein